LIIYKLQIQGNASGHEYHLGIGYVMVKEKVTWYLLHPFRHLGEKIRGAYMPSWVLLSMTAVEERVRERKTKL
jgi:hypothetical protein